MPYRFAIITPGPSTSFLLEAGGSVRLLEECPVSFRFLLLDPITIWMLMQMTVWFSFISNGGSQLYELLRCLARPFSVLKGQEAEDSLTGSGGDLCWKLGVSILCTFWNRVGRQIESWEWNSPPPSALKPQTVVCKISSLLLFCTVSEDAGMCSRWSLYTSRMLCEPEI